VANLAIFQVLSCLGLARVNQASSVDPFMEFAKYTTNPSNYHQILDENWLNLLGLGFATWQS